MEKRYFSTRRTLLGLTGLAACLSPALFGRSAGASTADIAPIKQPAVPSDKAFIERAFAMRDEAVSIGDQAFGAVIVRDGLIVGQSASHVVVNNDPSAHAEMEAIRDAARRLGRRDLSGCTLYSSSRACPMCEAAAYWANIDRMVYARAVRDGGRPMLCR